MAYKELIEAISKELVTQPDQLSVSELAGENNTLIELRVAKGDIGKVIGRDGRTAQAMRTLLAALAAKHGKRVQLDIVD
jgi:uncharacterized protein